MEKLLAPGQSYCKPKVISPLKTLTPGYISFHFNFAPITPSNLSQNVGFKIFISQTVFNFIYFIRIFRMNRDISIIFYRQVSSK